MRPNRAGRRTIFRAEASQEKIARITEDAGKNSYGFSGMGGTRTGPDSLLHFVRRKTLITNPGPVQSMRDLAEEKPPTVMY